MVIGHVGDAKTMSASVKPRGSASATRGSVIVGVALIMSLFAASGAQAQNCTTTPRLPSSQSGGARVWPGLRIGHDWGDESRHQTRRFSSTAPSLSAVRQIPHPSSKATAFGSEVSAAKST